MRTNRIFAAACVVLTLTVSACSPGEQLAEQILESQEGVGDVEIDTDSGEVSIETDEGSATIGGGEIPDEFPVDVPDGGQVLGVFQSGNDMTLSMTYDGGDIDDVIGFFDNWIAGSSLEVANKIEVTNPRAVTWTLTVGDGGYTISVAEGGGDDVGVTIFVAGG